MILLKNKKYKSRISICVLLCLFNGILSPFFSLLSFTSVSATSPTTGLNVAPVITSSASMQVPKFTTTIGDITVTDDDNVVMQFGTDSVTGNTWENQTHAEMCNPVVVSSSRNDVDTNKQTVVRATNKTSTGFDIKVDNQNQDIPIAQSTDVDWVVMNEGTYDLIDDNANTFHVSADSVETTTIFGNSCRSTTSTTNVAFSPVFSGTPAVIHSISSDNDVNSIASTVNGADGDYRSEPTSSNMGLFMQVGHGSCVHEPEDVDYIAMDQGHYTFGGVEVDSVKSGVVVASVTATGNDVAFSSGFNSVPQTILTSMLGVNGANGGHANVHSAGTVTATTFPATLDEDGNTARSHTTEPVGALAFETDSGQITQPNIFAYSLVGGDDMAEFQINGSGSLSFIVGKDGDNPTDTDSDGIYEVEVQVCDSHCNSQCSTQTVSVEVDKKPIITLNGVSPIDVVQGTSYTDLGAVCSDSFDGSCTVTSTGTVDTTRVGTYTIDYNSTDSNGNIADSVTRTVNVTPAAILINEVEYDTAGNEAESEWFEIFNPTSGTVNIENWTVTEKVGTTSSKTYTFGDVAIPAGGYIVITNETADFQALYPGITPDVDLPGTSYFALKNSPSDELLLEDPNGIDIDFVAWENTSLGWNIAGTDASICRLSVPDTDTVADWTSGCNQTPQAQNEFNFDPTDITLSNDTVTENNTAGLTIGALTSTDEDASDTHTYTLVTGSGDTDNASFSISGSNLIITPVTDYETQSSYAIRIATNDGKGGIFEEEIIITVIDENLAPTSLVLSNNVLDENNGIGDVIGTLTGTDDGEDTNTLTYALSCTTAGADDSSFSISGNSLNAGAVYDYETQNTYNICVQVSDGVLTYDENFIITINDLDEVPPVVTITPGTKLQNSAITDTTVVITDDIGVNLSDVDSTGGALSCTQTSSIQVDCTSNIPVSGDLIVNALDTSSNAGTVTEPNYIVDIIPPNIPNVSVDTSSGIDTPTVTFSSLDNVAVDYYTVTYTSATGILTTINPATSPVDLVLDSNELVHTIVVTAYDTAGNSSASTIKFPPIVTINAPTTLSNATITDSTVTITSPPGNDLTNIMLVTSTTGASLGTCTGNGGDTTDPYATPVICDINGISDSGSISILAEDASNGAEGLNSQSYIIDTTPPVITITAPTKLDNTSITDTTITVIDETAVTSANVVIDGTTSLTSSAYSCIQINPSQVNCTISIDTSGDLVISATDNAGNNDLENEDSYIIDTLPPVLTLVGNDPETVEYLASYSDAGADFTDNIDGTGSVVGVGTVNTGILGSYPINYNYTDTAGNPATQISRTVNVVDTTPPVISIIGNAIETVEVNTSYTDAGASSTDNYDGNLTTSIVATDNIDITNIGSYTVNYDVVDTNGNVATTVTRTVNVVDTTPPVISLVGLDEIILEVGSTYTEQGATVNDNYETLLPTNITIDSSAVNTSVLGTYSVTYNISDSSGNAAIEVIREVTVQDTTIPVISLVGNNPETIEVHSTYSDAGATALDNYDGDISGNISSVVSVNTAVLGSNTVTYDVIDSSSNAAIQATRTVNVVDTTDPVITLNGASTITQEVGSTYTDLGAGVSDNFDVNSNVVATGVVDTNTVGSYTLTYNHTDSSGNTATTITRTVIIEDTTDPVITLNGLNLVTVVVGYPYDDLGATCVDNYDTSCSVTSSGSVNTTATGSTLITYNAIDVAGNDSSLTRTVNIVPGDVPVITLNGLSPITQEVHSSYTDLGANFSDTEDGTGSLVGTGIVDITTVGTYNITYDHTDISGNPAEQVTRTVNIVDTTDPIITLNGSGSITQEVGSTYTDAGAIMNDNYDATTNVTANGIVNSSSVGVYTLTYDYTDTNLNTATQVTRTVNIVDTTDPIITLNGSGSITQEVGSTYTDAGAIMNDNYDSTTLLSAVGTVDINTLGTYDLTYNYTDANGNVAAQVTRTVNIVDTTNPVVSVTGSNPESIFVNGIFTDSGASWTDNVDVSGTILTATSGTVDNSTPGIYTLTYLYTDTSGNTHSVSRTVNVVTGDTPIINVVGNSVITQEVGLAYIDVGAEYSDTEDGTGSIIGVGSVDINTVSSYNIDYDYTDFSGNLGTQVTRTVNIVDTTSPIISLAGTGVISIFRNGTYIEQGATCTDNYDIACSVQISGIVDTSVLGSYIVSYDSEDANNNLATTVTRTVNVISGDTPIINLTGSGTIIQEVGSSFTDLGAIANDTEDGAISIIGSGTVDTSSLGTYILTYDYTDFSSNIATQVTRTINIVDTTAPVVNVTGSNPETIFVNATFVDSGATWTDNVDISGSITSAMSGSVDITSPGTYTLTYSYTDTSGNTHLATRIVNVVTGNTPIINVVGDSVITQEVLSSYTDVGAEYSDIEDGTGSLLAVGSVNTNLVGVYNLTYDYTDFSGNIATQATRTVNIVDTTNPVIVLNGSGNITQEVGSPYTDLGAVFTDNVDGVGAVSTVGAVDINTVGSYPLIYNYTDANGNIATQVIRTVNIVDTTDPVISLNGSTTITQEVGSVYTDASAIMTDNYDSSSTISANGIVNINTVGTYNLTYDYTDTNGNVADQVTRTVNIVDTTNPILSLVGNDPVSIFVNGTFIDDGATWVDNVDGSGNIVTATSGSVDPSIPGVYTLTYEYTDSSGNIQSIIRIVNVEAGEIPIINVVGESNITQEVTSVYVDEGAEYSDIEDGTGSLAGVGTVDINTVGAYEITYSYTDFSGNDAVEVTRIVNILDTEKPVVTTTGNSVMTHYLGEDYIDDGATCSDNYDTNCSIVTSGEVNISLLGEYIITYTVTDSSGNISESIRTVTVIRSPSSTSSSGGLTSSARMDICNETGGDFSGDYYDGLCENESQINVMEEVEVTETTIGDDDNLDNDFSEDDTENEEKTEDLIAEVVIDTSENNMDELGDINEEESEKIVNDNSEVTIKDIGTEIVMTKEINSEVVNYSLINNYQVCSIIDNLLDENYIDGFDTQLIDIVNSDYKKLIMSLEKAGVVTGTQEGTFEGNRDISRVEFLKFVLRSHCIEYRNEDPSFLEFRDLDNSTWQAKVVKKSVELGIANGDLDENGNKVFRADDIISSIEATKILMRMALIQKGEEPSTQYLDLEIEWHNKYVKQGEYLGVFSAEDDNYKFNPNDGINRNKTVEFLYKVIKLYR